MERYYLLLERCVTAIERIAARIHAVEMTVEAPGTVVEPDDEVLRIQVTLEPDEVTKDSGVEPDEVVTKDSGKSKPEAAKTPVDREALVRQCEAAGIPVRSAGSLKGRATKALQKDYDAWSKKATEEAENPTKSDVISALQAFRKRSADLTAGNKSVVELLQRVSGVNRVNELPSYKYIETIEEANRE